MFKNMTRSRAIQIWFVVVAVIAAASLVLDAAATPGTWAALLGLCLAPPAFVLLLWPGGQQAGIRDVFAGIDRAAERAPNASFLTRENPLAPDAVLEVAPCPP